MYLGLDIGTSAIKAVLVDESQQIVSQASVAISLSRPRPDWSEQDPEDWWKACVGAIAGLNKTNGVRGQ